MPNGDPDWDAASLEEWFAPIADAVVAFVARRNLFLDKYYHQAPSWSLRFTHPKGGEGKIALDRRDDGTLSINTGWFVEDETQGVRSAHSRGPRVIERDPAVVAGELEAELTSILQLDYGQWTEVYQYDEVDWENRRDEPRAIPNNYPVPRMEE